ncbi:UDP-2,3-diacylglucosamine diphosphatase [candidate division WOR-3 bacterium]|nr:UDP-2,3-diacylglucosamine diphosphatase [candidate division WOR-3 bacterium]
MKDVIYCISDAHLGADDKIKEKRKEKYLLSFLEKVKQEKADLIIGGDLFDFYFEYNSVIPRLYFDVLAKLKEIIKAGVSVWFIAGNHDFWVGPFFEKEIGVRVYKKSMKFKCFSKRIYFAHGDGLGRFDLGHLLLQLLLRQPINIFLFSLLHPNCAYALGRWVSKMSRQKSSKNKFSLEGHPLKSFAENMWEIGYDAVILGHIHYPHIEEKDGKIFAIIGDWIDNFSYIRISKNGISLHYFKNKTIEQRK